MSYLKDLKKDWAIIIWMICCHTIGLIGPFFVEFSWGAVILCYGMYLLTGMLGITLGYHRLLSHRAFKAPKWVERVLGFFGVLALQGSPMEWVGHHRMHHADVDTPKDPHNARWGFWYSHIGWLFFKNPVVDDPKKIRAFSRDIHSDWFLNLFKTYRSQIITQVVIGLLLGAIGGVSWMVYGIFLRLCIVYHVTWLVNSATHKWGYRNYETEDLSSNTWWVGLLAFGEGWHNNHHAFQDVAPAGRKWWEFDLTWQVIKVMEKLGLAYDIKREPTAPEAAKIPAVGEVPPYIPPEINIASEAYGGK